MLHRETVIENRPLAPGSDLYRLVLKGAVAATAQPGQFVHLQVGVATDPLLRRPISIAGSDRAKGEVTLFYRVAGRGTALLTRVRAEESLSVIGPVGKGFTVPAAGELLLVAGGIGLFPLLALAAAVDRSRVKVKVLWGGENRSFLETVGRATLFPLGMDYAVATLDGSMGHRGMVTDLLRAELSAELFRKGETGPQNVAGMAAVAGGGRGGQRVIAAAACGPKGMLQAVTGLLLHAGVPVEVSLEERMACGVGACLGCACTVRTADGALARKRVCRDGPVFDGKEVVWVDQD
ncbi:MAG: dihydroorotate dehydrogenase electron transfer subunit [Firmicutes bacterium]|nr:dihydroorotate dehydrogenase electron transfer subunit [Bacillota bacterium]